MTRFGTITEQEAATRGLLRDAVAEVGPDGRVLARHAATGLQWTPAYWLVRPEAPRWQGGLPVL